MGISKKVIFVKMQCVSIKHNYSQSYIDTRLRVLLGGRAAEQLVFNELTTGAGNDIEVATDMARKMVCEWGMSNIMGPLTFGKKDEEVFLGRDITNKRGYSDSTALKIDEEVTRIIREAENAAIKLLGDNEELLHRVAKELLKHETIDGNDLDKIIDGKTLRRRRKSSIGSKEKRKSVSSGKSKKKKLAEESA